MALVTALPQDLLGLREDGLQRMQSEGKRFTGQEKRADRRTPSRHTHQGRELRTKVLPLCSLR